MSIGAGPPLSNGSLNSIASDLNDPGEIRNDTDVPKQEKDISKHKDTDSIKIEVADDTKKDEETEDKPDYDTDGSGKKSKPLQKAHRRAHNEYHCLDDVCILVRVPSSATYISRLSGPDQSKNSDESLQAYARRAQERYDTQDESDGLSTLPSKQQDDDSTSESIEERTGVAFADKSKSEDVLLDNCLEFVDHITFAKEFVKNVIYESEGNLLRYGVVPKYPYYCKFY